MPSSIRSGSRRGSKESRKSPVEHATGSKQDLALKQSSTIATLYREENNDLPLIYSIRDEIIKNVLDECMRREQEKNHVKYVIRCAYKAMRRLIEFNFFVHDFGKDDFENNIAWLPDEKPLHSPPDTWAAYNVPVVSTIDEELEDKIEEKPAPLPLKESDMTIDRSSKTQTGDSVDNTPPPSLTDVIEQYLVAPASSAVELEEYPDDDEVYYVKKEKSVFTTLMTCSTESNPFTQYSSTLKWKDTQTKVPKLPKINLEKKLSKGGESRISITSLPPLRAEAQLKIMSSFNKDPKKEKEKDK